MHLPTVPAMTICFCVMKSVVLFIAKSYVIFVKTPEYSYYAKAHLYKSIVARIFLMTIELG